MYEQFAHAIHQKYPQLVVEGENYPAPSLYMSIAQFLNVAKFILIFLILSGSNPFTVLNMETPNYWTWAIENKVRKKGLCY